VTWDYLIVGAGFAGAVLAERLASQCGATCLVIDRRAHIAGNAHDRYDAAGVLVHDYGPHYFRTNSDRIVEYLSQFTEWHPVDYKILSWTGGQFWPFPINLNTFEQLVGHPATSEEMASTLAEWRIPIAEPRNSEEVIVSQVDEDQAGHKVKQFQGFNTDIHANDEKVYSEADFRRTVVRADVAFRSAVEYADLHAVAALESNREFGFPSITWPGQARIDRTV
jgi:UDP-galactopyranose mutase